MTISDTRLAIAAGMTSGEVLPEASYCEAVEDAPWMLRLQFDDFQQTSGTLSGHARNSGIVFSGSLKDYNAAIPCFTGNSVMATRIGLTRVADLRLGDLVLTRDNGLQPNAARGSDLRGRFGGGDACTRYDRLAQSSAAHRV